MNSVSNYALITGASAGTGKAIANECAKRGFNLYLVSLPGTGLEDVVADLKKHYTVDVQFLSIDLRLYDAPQKVFDFAQEKKLSVNILINNAGLGFNGNLESLNTGLIDTMILLNVRASTLLSFLFLAGMKRMDKAYILNMSSFGSFSPLPYKSVYAATKTYLQFLTVALHEELKGTTVSVTSVHPNGILSERALSNIKKSGGIARMASLTPQQVAYDSIETMLAGKRFLVPGRINKFYYWFGLCLPHGIVLKLVGRVFRKADAADQPNKK